jgi:hypothetical protein
MGSRPLIQLELWVIGVIYLFGGAGGSSLAPLAHGTDLESSSRVTNLSTKVGGSLFIIGPR